MSRIVELWMIYLLKNTFQNISVKNNEYVPTYSPDLLRKKIVLQMYCIPQRKKLRSLSVFLKHCLRMNRNRTHFVDFFFEAHKFIHFIYTLQNKQFLNIY